MTPAPVPVCPAPSHNLVCESVSMSLPDLFRAALETAGEAVTPALGQAEARLLGDANDPQALACKGALLVILASTGMTEDRRLTYIPTGISLMAEALMAGDPADAVLRWTAGMGLGTLPLNDGQAPVAMRLLKGAIADPALMGWQRLHGLTMMAGLCQLAGQDSEARRYFAAAQAIDLVGAAHLFCVFMDRRNGGVVAP